MIRTDHGLRLPTERNEPVVWHPPAGASWSRSGSGGQSFEVYVGGAGTHDGQRLPIAGRCERTARSVRFWPAFGFTAGQDYAVRLREPGSPDRWSEFRVAGSARPPGARVTAVYPSSDALPENILRFYVHFSVPMAPHVAHEAVQLRSESGEIDHGAFMRFTQELWSSDRTRLTVLVDPARIKRELTTAPSPRPALVDGGRYMLTVADGWSSADGASTLPGFTKSFEVGSALRSQPEVAGWRSSVPRAGTTTPLVVRFERPFDRHQLCHALGVVSDDGDLVSGTPQVGPDEMSWSFTPTDPWRPGSLRVVVADTLEDIAGNNLRGPLERTVRPG